MSDQATHDAINTAELILDVDAQRAPGDSFLLPPASAQLVQTRLNETRAINGAVVATGAATIGASAQRKEAFEMLADLLTNGHRGIQAIPEADLPDAVRAQVRAAYGWDQGLIGTWTHGRIERMARLVPQVAADASVPAAGKYSVSLNGHIANALAIVDAAELLANGGTRQTLIQQRNEARERLEHANSRVRFHYCSASDDLESTPELARIGFQPKRAPGEAQASVPVPPITAAQAEPAPVAH